MGVKRPWKVDFHYDGTKTFPNSGSEDPDVDPGAYVIDTTRPIDSRQSSADESTAHRSAEQVSRNGGTARVIYQDPVTKHEKLIREYAPYESAMDELQRDSGLGD